MGLDVSCTAVALAVESDWNHAGKETVVVGFLNGCLVVCLLRWVAVFWPLIGDGNDNLSGVGVPAVVGLRWWVSGDVSCRVFPRETSPVRTRTPVFTGIAGIGVAVVDGTWEFSNTTGIIARCLSEWRGSWPGVLVVALTVSRACCTWEGVAKTVNGLVDGHVAFFKHGFDALEVRSAGKVTAVDNGTDVSPFGVHGT